VTRPRSASSPGTSLSSMTTSPRLPATRGTIQLPSCGIVQQSLPC